MTGKRHASDEIGTKLAQARQLAAQGKTQRDISKALGISVMTYHRWRKMLDDGEIALESAGPGEVDHAPMSTGNGPALTLESLRAENSQLRRLVTDVMLDKQRLEDELRSRRPGRYVRSSSAY